MSKNLSLTLKLSLLPAVALLGLLLYVGYSSLQLANNDHRLLTLENTSFPTLEKADAVIFQFSRIPGLLNNAVAAGEPTLLDEAREVRRGIESRQQELQALTAEHPQLSASLAAWREAVQRYSDNALSASA